jgi:SAM-dependent methyltransferase
MAHRSSPPTDKRQRLLARIAEVLVCPQCRHALELDPHQGALLRCRVCGSTARRNAARFDFGGLDSEALSRDWLDRTKGRAKRLLGGCYPLAIHMLSPVLGTRFLRPFLGSFDLQRELVADLGSGAGGGHDDVVCVDGVAYDAVHVVCDLDRLPFRTGSLAGIVSVAVLEHMAEPERQVAEMKRALKPGGRLLCYVPFIQGYHASPDDYRRFTRTGLRELFADFEIVDVRVGAGPTSGMLWIVQEWLAMVLSLGSLTLYRLILPLMWILSPIKLLDLVLSRHPAAGVIASAFVVEARKRHELAGGA